MNALAYMKCLSPLISILAIVELCFGLEYINDCRSDPRVPVWLIVCGTTALLRTPVFVVSYCNFAVRDTYAIVAAVAVFLLQAFDLGWLVHGAMMLMKTWDYADALSPEYCDEHVVILAHVALYVNAMFLPIFSSAAVITLQTDERHQAT